jgi:FKBP-type peptidyl-prolyl cis-trans isomerase SlyD
VVVGGGYVLPGLDDALLQMNVGEKKTLDVPPEKAFGERDQTKVHTLPESEFKKHGTTPKPGMVVEANDMRGRVVSVTSGRVTVDFNHPLAGKVLVYELEITGKIERTEEKVLAIVSYFTKLEAPNITAKVLGREADVTLPPVVHPVYKKRIASEIMKYTETEKVRFSEVFEKGKAQE